MSEQRTLVVNYHYCISEAENPYLARTAVSPACFERQIEQLSRFRAEYGVEPLVTFDDGTRDIWLNAIPVLARYGVPSILFCCSLPLSERRMLNVTKIHMLQGKLGLSLFRTRFMAALRAVEKPYDLDDPERLNLGRLFRYDVEEVREFKFLLNVKLPYPLVTELLDILFEQEFGAQEEAAKSIYMSKDDLRRARDMGARVGLHTHSHFMLARLTENEQEAEIRTNLSFFGDLVTRDSIALSYPHGVEGTWNEATKSILMRQDIKYAYTLGRRIYVPSAHLNAYEIPRFDVNDVFERDGTLKTALLN